MKKTSLIISCVLLLFTSCRDALVDQINDTEADLQLAGAGVTVKPANKFTNLFNRYGNGWTGGDASYSVALPDGRSVWMFGDSFLDTVYADYTRPFAELVRNSFVVQQGNNLTTIVGGTIDDPSALVDTDDPTLRWYWPGDGTVIGDTLYVYMMYFQKTGPGGWDYAYQRTDLVAYSLPAITEISRTTVFTEPHITWGTTIMEDGGFNYVYGTEGATLTKYMHVLRYPAGNIHATPEYWNGSGWTTTIPAYNVGRLEKQSGFAVDVSAQFAVFYAAGKYRLVTQHNLFGPDIYSWESINPTGPWKQRQTIYVTPETGDEHFTYNAWVHPEFGTSGYMLLTYNENSNNFLDLFNDARIYRPKFIFFKYN
ncbi:MAG: DUF5005 domain-containing protein [Chitinophagales bacterium]